MSVLKAILNENPAYLKNENSKKPLNSDDEEGKAEEPAEAI
jgi:hypothetical protein